MSSFLQRAGAVARRWLARFSGPGLAVGLAFFWLALGPALTPRPALFQGASAGVCAAIGYGLGAAGAALARLTPLAGKVPAVWRRRGWWILAVAGPLVVVGGLIWSANWQHRLRELMGMPQPASVGSVVTLLTALVLFTLLLQAARGLRVTARAAARLIGRWLPRSASLVIAAVVVALVTVLVLNGVAGRVGRATLETTFSALDGQTFEGNEQPAVAQRSGSSASAQAWDTLGREGRRFVSGGPSTEQLRAFDDSIGMDREVTEPIRVYAGRTSADSLDGVAANVVAELDRTDAWDRSVLVVTTTTGTGWVDPSSAAAIELAWGGDTAIAAMQYSYLPSWVSFVGDRSTPTQAGVALFEAVRAAWEAQPADHRPALYVYGISLGSFGSQGAFASLDDVLARTDGAVWVGVPGFTPLWEQLTAARDAGSTQIAPVLDGGTHVRWGVSLADTGDGLYALGEQWSTPRVVYLQHASDGVIWWSPSLLFSRPDWSREPRGADVLPDVRWTPIVTFWQLTIDQFVAGDAPSGHGHNYAVEYADAWTAVATPPSWTTADTVALRAAIASTLEQG